MTRMTTRQHGFTLIELLAASALATVLMLVLFQVLGSLGRTRAALAQKGDPAWKSDLVDLLRRDLSHATAVRLEPGRLTVSGYGALDRLTRAAGHEPVTVVYELDRARLVRRQMPRNESAGEPAWSEIVCAGASRMSVEPMQGPRQPGLPQRDPLATPLRFRLDGPGGEIVDEVIVIR
jgi:prepilin-type N-terminal cleavage/methylation domain-containing protein